MRLDLGPDFNWLKRLMPGGLYGRAALILVLPVVVVTLVVSVMFLQRHFEDVTRQMTQACRARSPLVGVGWAARCRRRPRVGGEVETPLDLTMNCLRRLPTPNSRALRVDG